MKKMWKLNNKAVSPVIATILMVAITVVLAAVLYVMVMGFGADTNQAPTASLAPSGDRLVITISENQDIKTNMALQVMIGDSTTKYDFNAVNLNGTGIGNIIFNDAGSDDKVNTGDYFTRTGTTPVLVKIVWTSGGSTQVLAEGTI
jgi:flagellin-like protein